MKRLKKAFSFAITAILALATLTSATACGGTGGGEQVDVAKSQLYIGTYGGGFGTKYLEDLKVRFEEYAKDKSFEDGRTGVQVFYQEDKDKYEVGTFVNTISYDENELFYLSGDKLDDFLKDGNLLDITDVVTTPLTEFGETRSIADKLNQAQKNHLCRDGKYYSMPFAESSLGLIYDIDVFEENNLYFAKNGCPSEALQDGGSYSTLKWVGAEGERSAGPDGDYSTAYDNGLPATLDEFQLLIDKMYVVGVDSIVWTGQYADTYTSFLPRAFHVNYHGANEAGIVYNGGGENGVETRIIESFTGETPVVTKEVIGVSKNNVKDLTKQAGYYYGLKMFEIMLSSNTVSNYSIQELSHVRTQEKFLVSNHRDGENPIAFMIDGAWWENEAYEAGTFNDTKTEFNLGREDRRFGFYVMPNATTEDLQARINSKKDDDPSNDILNTIFGGTGSLLVNAKIAPEKANLAKEFIRFSLTDESLRRFTINTSLPASFNYEMKAEDLEKMTYFAKNYWEVYSNSSLLYEYKTPNVLSNSDIKNIENILSYQFSTNPDTGVEYGRFSNEVYFNQVTVKDYFTGMNKRATK